MVRRIKREGYHLTSEGISTLTRFVNELLLILEEVHVQCYFYRVLPLVQLPNRGPILNKTTPL